MISWYLVPVLYVLIFSWLVLDLIRKVVRMM